MSKLTTTEINTVISKLLSEGKKVSTKNVRTELGYGSYSSIQEILRELGYLDDKQKIEDKEESNDTISRLLEKYQQELQLKNKEVKDKEYLLKKYDVTISKKIEYANNNLKHFNDRILKDKIVPTIPNDLIKLLNEVREVLYKKISMLSDNKGDYYLDKAKRLHQMMILNKDS
ncbi:MAG: DNA-binding protein [Succinivibrionaceae bacterium]